MVKANTKAGKSAEITLKLEICGLETVKVNESLPLNYTFMRDTGDQLIAAVDYVSRFSSSSTFCSLNFSLANSNGT